MATRKKDGTASVPRPKKFDDAQLAVKAAVAKYPSQAEAARATGVAKSYLSRLLQEGTHDTPGEQTLSRLGITRTVVYTVEAN